MTTIWSNDQPGFPGRLFIVEGIDGSGKSTQLSLLQNRGADRAESAGQGYRVKEVVDKTGAEDLDPKEVQESIQKAVKEAVRERVQEIMDESAQN